MPDTALPCPRCGIAMQHRALAAHLGRTVGIDHCTGCRLLWFDTLESVALAPLGWVALLRGLQLGSGLVLPDAKAATLACPHCRTAFKTVHNRTRFGAFAALECPRGHGHLHTASGVLAERGLARPLLPAERSAILRGGKQLACVNCGAPADGQASECRYCAGPIVVIDLPRLMHALTRHLGDDTPSPRADGRVVPWHCVACGTALDPSRQEQCPACGTAALAPSLPEIEPLLDAAEAELKLPQRRVLPAPERRVPRERHRRDWRDTSVYRLRDLLRHDGDDTREDDIRRRWPWTVDDVVLRWLWQRLGEALGPWRWAVPAGGLLLLLWWWRG